MLTIIGSILAFILPLILESLNPKNKVRRADAKFDKALTENNVDDLSIDLSQRFDRLS